jgi:Sulfotransferase family
MQRFFARFRKNKLLATIFNYTGKQASPKKWIFIIGCYNSGTTLLDQILTQHPQVTGLEDEGVMLTNKLPRPEDFAWRRMWLKCEKEMQIPFEKADRIAAEIKRHWSHFYVPGKPFLIEKSISNTPRAIFFNSHFKPAYFIHIVRNGYAVAEGIRRKAEIMHGNPLYGQSQYPLDLCVKQWVRSLQVVESQQDQLENFLEISYEALTRDPDDVMKQVCDFLGIDRFSYSLKDVSFTVHRNEEAIRDMNHSSFKNLSDENIATINSIARPYLEKYNYYLPTR